LSENDAFTEYVVRRSHQPIRPARFGNKEDHRMKAFIVTGMIASLAALPSYADCVAPTPMTEVPNGATASRDDMVAALKAVKVYDAAVNAYAECVHKTGGNVERGNEAVDKLHRIADRFNAELRVFKAKSGA
jgi:hypothetical protein